MAGALFAPAQVGMIVLPLMIFHQLQLFVCAWLAARFAREAEEEEIDIETKTEASPPVRVPQTDQEIAMAAAAVGIDILEPCAPGVAANLALLATHAERLRGERP
jgi:sodium/bile acid cotransporter 7